ncbi:hypothetical protein AGMMS49959_08580 [Planctomycetales bacterium]|nr:hypothetical protein AGMMS49959_08580 [Planctomycetales bacterium]
MMSLLVTVIVVAGVRSRRKEIQRLKDDYDDALRGADKQRALIAGRLYYQKLRGGNLTIYDESALNNDLATMK